MDLFDDLAAEVVDRCMVCGGESPDRDRRQFSATYGGAYAQLGLTIEYCGDNPACGEARAAELAEALSGQFVLADLRRRGIGILDLRVAREVS